MTTALTIGLGLLGLAVGSFLNVVIYRVPLHLSVISPRSRCPNCGSTLRDRDNIPVVSWLVLRGRCRDCRSPISIRYPLVEIATAGLFVGVGARFGFAWPVPAMCALMAGLLALGAIDVERLVLPRVLVYTTGLAVAGWLFIATVATHEWHRLLVAIIASAVWFAFFFTINALLPRALGFGDVRLSLLLGFALGWLGAAYPALALFSGSLFGVLVACALIVTSRASRRDPVPFGVFLGAGSAFAVFAGPEIIELLRHAH